MSRAGKASLTALVIWFVTKITNTRALVFVIIIMYTKALVFVIIIISIIKS